MSHPGCKHETKSVKYGMKVISLRQAAVSSAIITFIILLYRGTRQNSNAIYESTEKPHVETQTSVSLIGNKTHVLLAWTPIFGNWEWYPSHDGLSPFQNHLCNYKDCLLTKDRSYLPEAEVVLFYCADAVDFWPGYRHPRQLYGVACQESPMSTNFRTYGGRMNITMTYRRDSDVPFPFCWFRPATKPLPKPYMPPIALDERLHSIVWPVSNCYPPSQRQLYANELAKHIDLHIYGRCGPYKCDSKTPEDCMRHFSRNYKFYASFENAFCKDYVTEKFFYPLLYDLIPIVLGGADYSVYPKKSYINVMDFRSPKHLADYLKFLSNNATAYNEYFQWKTTHIVDCSNKEQMFCGLCEMARSGQYKKQYPDANKWWTEGECDNTKIKTII